MSAESSVRSEILAYLGQLGPEDQLRVADLARVLTRAPKRGTPGKELLRVIGSIPHDELEEMKQAIEEECERTEANEW